MTVADLAVDASVVQRLIDEGETLFVERKERDPADGLGATVASFANMLGGWLLIGVDDHGEVVGFEPPGRADLQDYLRELLRAQVDPLPPFAAVTLPVEGKTIGVVKVAESSDTPHITSNGVIYVRNPGGKQRVTEHRDILSMARRGEEARAKAVERQYGLPMIKRAMATPRRVFADGPPPHDELLEWIVRATPFTVTGAFADRALSESSADRAHANVLSLFPEAHSDPHIPSAAIQARGRGVYLVGAQAGNNAHVDMAVDAGGVVAMRQAWRRQRAVMPLSGLSADTLQPLRRAIAEMLAGLDGYGRALVDLEIRGSKDLTVQWSKDHIGQFNREGVMRIFMGGDLAIPASDEDVQELASRWTGEIARTAGLPIWEPPQDIHR
jgi:hypothetical protein